MIMNPLSPVLADAVPLYVSVQTAGANTVATFPAVPGWRNVLTGIQVSALGAVAGVGVVLDTTGCAPTANPKLAYAVPAGVSLAGPFVDMRWPAGIPATGPNVAITVTLPSLGVGNVAAVVNITGYRVRQR